MDANSGVEAAAYTIGGTGVLTTVFWFLRHAVRSISRDATQVVGDAAQRSQLTDLRDEIKRLEKLVKNMNQQVLTLRFAFVDEHSALLRVLSELSGEHTKEDLQHRITTELEAANKRRADVMRDLSAIEVDEKEKGES